MQRFIGSILILVSIGLFIQACAPQIASEPDCGFVQNVYGQRVSWKGRTPIPLYVHESFPSQFRVDLERSLSPWLSSDGKPLFYIAGTVNGPINPKRDGSNVIYWMDTWEIERNSEQARTSIYWESDKVREADVRINAKDFEFYGAASPGNYIQVHLESLLIHELGHVVGLKHNDQGASVMATYLQSQTERVHLSSQDSASLRCEY